MRSQSPSPPTRPAPNGQTVRPMRVVYAIGTPKSLGPAICAVGAFDGVHRGHQALAERTAALAQAHGAASVAVVLWEGEGLYDAHRGEETGREAMLSLLDERLARLGELGLFDAALVISRAPDAPALDADAVLAELASRLEPVAVLAAEVLDGSHTPTPGNLVAAAAKRGIRAESVEIEPGRPAGREAGPEHERGRERTTIGSHVASAVKNALLAGDARTAQLLLGHPYGIMGEVVGGDRRGRVLGYPTANLRLDPRKLLPADGVYAVRARLPGESEAAHPAVASLGVRPQFGANGPRLLEVFLLDATLDLYGLTLGVEFVERLREQRRFADVEALKAQMARDVEVARDVLKSC